jgi:hypothetical protein
MRTCCSRGGDIWPSGKLRLAGLVPVVLSNEAPTQAIASSPRESQALCRLFASGVLQIEDDGHHFAGLSLLPSTTARHEALPQSLPKRPELSVYIASTLPTV